MEMTATSGRQNFQGRTREKTRKGIEIKDLGGQESKPQAAAVVDKSEVVGKIVRKSKVGKTKVDKSR